MTSSDNIPFCIIPDLGKSGKDNSQAFISQIFDIFYYYPLRLSFYN